MADISVTVPIEDFDALMSASNMLYELATGLKGIEPDDYYQKYGRALRKPETVAVSDIADDDNPFAGGDGPFNTASLTTNEAGGNDAGEELIADLNTSDAPPPPPTTVIAPATTEVDADGLPWDARIHASSQAKVAEGTWRKKRGVDKALVASVEIELRNNTATPPVELKNNATHAAPIGVTEPMAPQAPSINAVVPPPPPAPAAEQGISPAALMGKISASRINPSVTLEVFAKYNIPDFISLTTNPDNAQHVQAIHDELFPG